MNDSLVTKFDDLMPATRESGQQQHHHGIALWPDNINETTKSK